MDTLVDPSEQQTTRRSSSRMKVDAPRNTLPSVADAEVQWFARTGAFPRAPSTSLSTSPPPAHDRLAHDRLGGHLDPRFDLRAGHLLDSDDLEDDDDELAEDVALDSFSTEADSDGDLASDESSDTLVLATRPFVRARIWSSED